MRAPREAYELVGRVRAIAELAKLGDQHRLVTIWGPGGIGKTRLALRLFRDASTPAWFCDVSGARDAVGLCSALAYALDVTLESEPIASIGHQLARRGPLLIVLDNFEQLAHLAGSTISRWLDLAPETRFLVSSRERLRLPDEVCFELGPLELPRDVAELAASEAFVLLALRLRAIDPTFDAGAAHNAQAMVRLLAMLEGIPLAIELAAPRVALLGASALLERLAQSIGALSTQPSSDATPCRQASLRDSMRWSWALLSPLDQRALAWCSVFRGGFEIDAAEALLGAEGVERIRALRDASLLRAVRPGRFSLYESVRELALEQLEARGERLEACARHATLSVQRATELSLAVEERGEPLERLQEERWNIEQALRWSVASGEREQAVLAMLALVPVLTRQGPLRHLLEALEQTLGVAPAEPRLLHARGKALQALGRLTEAERDLQAAFERAREPKLSARVCKDIGVLEHQRRAMAAAEQRYEQARDLAAAAGDRRLAAICAGNIGALRHDTGDYAAARELYEEALAVLRASRDVRTEGVFVTNLAVLEQELGRFERARAGFVRAIDVLRGIGDTRAEGVALENLAVLEHLDGNLEASQQLHERALACLQAVGDERSEALCRARLGAVLAQITQTEAAREQLEQSAALLAHHDDAVARGVLAIYRGFIELAEGDRNAALERLRAARRVSGAACSPLVAISDDARAAARALEAWLARGTRLRLTIGRDAGSFRIGADEPQALDGRPTLVRLLMRLVELQDEAPDASLDVAALFAAGWPGEAVAHESAHNRVHVALAELRKRGLAPVLQQTQGRYRLDPDWLVLRER